MEPLCHIFPLSSNWLTKQSNAGVLNPGETKAPHNSVLFLGAQQLWKSSLLFQAAVSYASEGRRVVYICRRPLESLPAGIHGMPCPRTEVMTQVKMLVKLASLLELGADQLAAKDLSDRDQYFWKYLSTLTELMNYLSSIQIVADAPGVLIICNLYFYAAQNTIQNTQHSLRKLCSLLSDVVSSLEEKSNGAFKALVSSSEEFTLNRPIYSRYIPEIYSITAKENMLECKKVTDRMAQKITYHHHENQLFLDKVFEYKR